jgi:glyoxylase-like metal-dependent hydrolase (beta-lactamase superfamily II)
MVCHCLLAEGPRGLILVDTGLGLEDVRAPELRLGASFVRGMQPRLDPEETAARQLERLGFRADDVRDIVVTHLDLDHAGGLSDFPRAKVHVYDVEYAAAAAPRTWLERMRYRAIQWAHGPDWALAPEPPAEGERWFGFECVRDLSGLPPEVLLVPLVGHSRGHCGVAVQGEGGWLLHAGDAYFYRGEVNLAGRRCPPGIDLFQRLVQVDGGARMRNQERLQELARERGGDVAIFCAHDPVELEQRCAAAELARAAA